MVGKTKIKNIDYIKKEFESEGYTLITEEYKNQHQRLEYICPNGHRAETTLGNWTNNNNRCPYCYGNAKLKFSFVKKQIEKEGYKVLTTKEEYKNNRTKLHLLCPNGHDYYASWFDWNSNEVRCYKCKEKGTSIQEQDLITFIRSFDINIEVHDRYLIDPYELDIIIPDKKIAIEYCGLYWHSEAVKPNKNYHVNKLKLCESQGYRLITVFEDEWMNKRKIVKSRLSNILNNKTNKSIHARKCIIKEISTIEAKRFCEKNHLQGYTGASIKLGAFYNNMLVSVMTFALPSLSKGQKNTNEIVFELSRFCSNSNYVVTGIASKLLAYFKRNYNWKIIFSYADRRWSDGNLYEKIGFTLGSATAVNYWYFKSSDNIRKHRFALRKKPDEPKDVTEWELRKAQGWNRIWDCGNLKYVMHNKQE